jgi:hypothetical protein
MTFTSQLDVSDAQPMNAADCLAASLRAAF